MSDPVPEATGRLENWRWDERGVIWGCIFGDTQKRFSDGTYIHTSLIRSGHPFKKGDVVKTLNSTYLLGVPYDPRR